ncbi:MAG TPA: hypothetical protein VKX28_23730 [Xanthobacteraceae bacterium]|nr:hypothetical protein [Xanthobacteraceae bacterium]
MRIGSALLAATAALALAFTAGGAIASTRHYSRHHHHPAPAPAANAQPDASLNGNNPAKRYPTRHMSANAIKTATLLTTGNNPTKRYAVRHGSNLRMEATLSTSGNNPAKRYPVH